MPPPNILFITTDQQRFDHLGSKGLRAVPTPNLDRLAREGVHFDRAYCPSPLCTPCRVSLLTGRYPSSHYAYSIGVTAEPFPRPTLADWLGARGYATGLFGKTHFVRREDEIWHLTGQRHPPEDFFRHWHGPYLGFEECRVSTGHTTNNVPAMHYRVFLEDAVGEGGYRQWFPHLSGSYDHDQCGVWDLPAELHDTHWVSEAAGDFIRRQTPGKPWLAMVNFQDPHEPYVCPQPWYSRVNMSLAPAYEGYRRGEFENKPSLYRMALEKNFGPLNDGSVKDRILGGAVTRDSSVPSVFGEPRKEQRKREALQATLGMVGFLDDRLGFLLSVLEATGQADNTLVIFTSDHGEMHGHHGLWGKGFAAFEDCQRVPLLLWGPGLVQPLGTVGALANLVDLPKTILSMAGIELPQEIQGTDLSPVLRGEKKSVQEAVLIEMRATQHTLNQHTLVTERHKLVVYQQYDDGELYDLIVDPDQYRNLWKEPEAQDLKLDLLHRLARFHMEREPLGQPRVSFA